MTICCSKCHKKSEVPCFGITEYAIKKEISKDGWYMNLQGKIFCPECRIKERGAKFKSAD